MTDAQTSTLLCCPATRLPLVTADAELLAQLQAAATAGALKTASGRVVAEQFEGALVRSDRQVAYLVIDHIARLVADEAVPLS